MKNPTISNWKDVLSQFGTTTPIDKKYLSGFEIYKELIKLNKTFKPEDLGITIEYEPDNFDSGMCLFSYDKTVDNINIFTYTGTAK